MRLRLVPVMQPATPTLMPAALQAVTKPVSASVSRAMASPARAWSSSMRTKWDWIAAPASMASGTTREAPSEVMVPETLITGVSR